MAKAAWVSLPHADAHVALGAWNVEIVGKVGESARHLVLLFGEERAEEAAKLYAQAAKSKPMDAMERLDVEAARAARGRNTSP
jgi:hypothetical protein